MIIGIILSVLGIALFVIGALAWTRRLPGNSVVGIKVPEVRKSEEVWKASHQVAGPVWVVAAIAWILGAFLAFIATGWMWILPALAFVGGTVLLSVGANYGARTAVLLDEHLNAEDGCEDGSCDCGDRGCGSAPAQVDLDAARRAASAQDS